MSNKTACLKQIHVSCIAVYIAILELDFSAVCWEKACWTSVQVLGSVYAIMGPVYIFFFIQLQAKCSVAKKASGCPHRRNNKRKSKKQVE